jgi:N-acetylglutamate synthase-like GNAT family acetyltransferase
MSVSRSQGINVAFAVLAFSAIFLQKIGFTPTSDIASYVGLDDCCFGSLP